jgi:hypothetical protein
MDNQIRNTATTTKPMPRLYQPEKMIRMAANILEQREQILDNLRPGKLKFSQMLPVSTFLHAPISLSIYLTPDDILLHKNFPSLPQIGSGAYYISAGSRVWDYLKSTNMPTVAGWVRFRANDLGLKRPYVSIG